MQTNAQPEIDLTWKDVGEDKVLRMPIPRRHRSLNNMTLFAKSFQDFTKTCDHKLRNDIRNETSKKPT